MISQRKDDRAIDGTCDSRGVGGAGVLVNMSMMNLERLYREDHAFYRVIIGDLKAKIGPRRTPGVPGNPRPTME
ncbi:hypothetical protein RB195_015414 [Necator americanus]|uniref:Uncharacterized protein n=1 Tax=Necator americanus TaxID=51031 RepID=A0ABR1E4W7_NECAM